MKYNLRQNFWSKVRRGLALILVAVMVLNIGLQHPIDVKADTSDALIDFINEVSISKATEGDDALTETGDTWSTIKPDVTYGLNLSFRENSGGLQFVENGAQMTYALPAGVAAVAKSGTINISVTLDGVTYVVHDNPFTVDDSGNLVVNFNTADDNYAHLLESSNARFNVVFNAKFNLSNGSNTLDFGNGITKTVIVDASHNASVNKSCSLLSNGKMQYTITVNSSGTSENISIADTITGSALTLDPSSISVSGIDSSLFSTTSSSSTGFNATISKMTHGQTAVITYTADVDYTQADSSTGKISTTQTGNDVEISVTDDSDPSDNTSTTSKEIEATSISSKSGTVVDDGAGTATITWTVVVNSQNLMSLNGKTITDTFGAGEGQSYVTGSFTVKKIAADWSSVTENPTPVTSSEGWSYTFNDTEPYRYEITYQTTADVSTVTTSKTFNNNVSYPYGSKDGTAVYTTTGDNAFTIDKAVSNVSSSQITWTITVHVPKNGISPLVVEDTYPALGGYQDTFSSASITSGLTGDEHGDLDTSDSTKLKYTFYKTAGTSDPGLSATTNGRDVVITVVTNVNSDWLEAAKETSWLQTHKNTATATSNEITIRDTAETTPIAASISKSGSVQGTVDDGSGKKLPYYKYEVKISGVDLNQPNVTITDDLPSYLELYSTSYDHLRFYGGDQYYQGNDSTGTVTASATSGTISFTIPTANIAKNGDAAYGYYKLVYYAKVKNAAELANMTTAALSQDDNTLDIVNNATYSGNTAGSTITYKPDDSELITKELLNSDKINDDSDASNYKIAKYKIKINPDKKTMNSGNHLKLTDTFENLSIIYSSIQFSPAAESYDVSGTTLTAELLDATTYTLTYTCRVNGKGTVNYKNTADLEGFKATNDETKTFEADSSGSGSAFVPSIRVYKQKKGSGNTPLSGATFALYEVTTNLGTEILTPVTKTGGEQVTVTTGDDGTAQIKGVQSKDGWTLGMADEGKRYCIIETVAPTGYKLDQTKYYFQLGEESVYNPSTQTWIYMNDEEMRINNELADTGVLTVTKTLNGLAAGDVTDSFLSGITLTVKDANSATQSKTLKEIKDAYEGGDTTNYGYDATNQKYTWNLSGVGIGAAHVTETVTTPSGYSLTKTYNINGGSAAAYPASAGVPVTVSTTDQSVNLINTYASTNNGKITVSKTYNYHTATPQTFYFALFTDSAGTTRYGDVKSVTMSASDLTAPGTNASATKTVSFTDLAHDTYYVFETDADGKVLDAAAVAKLNYDCTTPLVGVYKEQAVSDDTEHTLTFENTEKKGQIVVKKTVKTAGDNILNATDCGNITLKITGPNSYEKTATLSAIRANSGLSAGSGAYVKASDGSMTYTWTITDLPLGTYEVTESSTDITNYTLSSQTFVVDGTGTSQTYSASNVPASAIAAGKDGNIALTNTYTEDTGKLVLAKALSGDATTDKETFLFYVTLKDRSGNLITGSRTYGGTTYTFDSAGTTEVPVKVGSNVTISGIPVGYTYTVSEKKNANNYAWVSSLATPAYSDHYVYASGTGLTGTIAEATDAKATITNQYQALSKLKITKEVTLDNQPAGTAIPTNDPFTIKVLLKNASNANISGTYNVSYLTDGVATDTGTITFDGTNPTEVSLKNKQSIVIHDVMYGYKYEVTEATYSYTSSDIMGTTEYYGYKNGTITNGTGTLVNNTTSEVTVGNLYREKPAAITIKKNVIYPDGYTLSESLIPADTLFKVHIAFTGTVSDGLHGSVTLTSNEGDVTFKNGETAAITGIPDGLSFTITEPSYSTDGGSNWTALDGTAKVGYYKGNGGDNIYDVTSGTRTTGIAAFTGTTNKDQTFALEIDNVYVPSEIYINKFSNASGTPALNGAKLRIIDTATNAVAKDAKGNNLEWTTDGNPKKITGLVADGAHQYILREINTPEGFQTIQDITFTISNYSTITVVESGTGETALATNVNSNDYLKVTDKQACFKIKKTDEADNLLPGAVLNLKGPGIDSDFPSGSVVDFIQMRPGTYTITETTTPAGYYTIDPITFVFKSDNTVWINGVKQAPISGTNVVSIHAVDKKILKVQIKKTDASGNPLQGSVMQLWSSDGTKKIHEWTSDAAGGSGEITVYAGDFILREISAPDGYTVITSDKKFHVDSAGNASTTGIPSYERVDDVDTSTDPDTVIIKDTPTKIAVQKTDVTGETALAGAVLQILDENGDVVKFNTDGSISASGTEDCFTTTTTAKTFTGLKTKTTYTLHEVQAPDGYKLTADTKFRLNEYGAIDAANTTATVKSNVLLVCDAVNELNFTKYGYYNEKCIADPDSPDAVKALEGVVFTATQIKDRNGSTVSGTPVTATSNVNGVVLFKGLAQGTYTIKETSTIGKYVLSDTVYYAKVTDDTFAGLMTDAACTKALKNNRVINDLKRANISFTKVSEVDRAKTLSGSTYGLYKVDASGDKSLINTAVTDADGKIAFNGVLLDTTYQIQEMISPGGYYVSQDPMTIAFTVDGSGNVVLDTSKFDSGNGTAVLNADGTITWLEPEVVAGILKVDEDGNALAGATLQIADSSGNVVAGPWTSTTEAYQVSGVLVVGNTYKLIETAAPSGYAIADPIEFTVDDSTVASGQNKVISVTMTDKKQGFTTEFAKMDENGKYLAGAVLEVRDAEGKNVIKDANGREIRWTTTNDKFVIADSFTPGTMYTLVEVSAPNGYYVADPVKFKIPEDAKETAAVVKVVMTDYPITTTPPTTTTPPPKTTPPVARTGDEMPLGLMLGLFGGSFLALIGIGVVYLKKKRRGEL